MKQILLLLTCMISVGFTNKLYIFSIKNGDEIKFRLETQHPKTLGVVIEARNNLFKKDLKNIAQTGYVTIFYTKNGILSEKTLHIYTAILSGQTVSLSFLMKNPTECREIGGSAIQKVIL